MTIRTGTSSFATFSDVWRYYGSRKQAEANIAEGLISIGAPALAPGQTLETNAEGRYVIVEEEPKQ